MNRTSNVLLLEILWIVVTIVVTVLLMLPIYSTIGDKYDFYFDNIFLIVVFITLTRWIFLLRHTFFAHWRWMKVALIFAPIPLLYVTLNMVSHFQRVWDDTAFDYMTAHMIYEDGLNITKYIRYEFMFFGTSTMIALAVLPIRMIRSIWMKMNKGRV